MARPPGETGRMPPRHRNIRADMLGTLGGRVGCGSVTLVCGAYRPGRCAPLVCSRPSSADIDTKGITMTSTFELALLDIFQFLIDNSEALTGLVG